MVSPKGQPANSGAEKNQAVEPIAIVGMACRFPGADNLDSFWQLLVEGGNSVTEVGIGSGSGRFDDLFTDPDSQHAACRFSAFVDGIDQFDAQFFRISPVEAELLDPQQRMMLETSWQALEDAGIDPNRLKGSRTGVYAGLSNDEYRMLVLDASRPSEAAGSLYALSGTNLNGASGRVSFVLGLMGPAKAVDAACAASLVAVNDAVADLRQGKADLAIVGGVQVILNSRVHELRAESMMLSPDGQCKAFDESADGYVRGEGCGVVVMKRLSEAEADGDRIWAVVRGTAVNHGGASVGLTVPNEPALVQVIEAALSDAGVSPEDVDFLEAHGTGTAVGDPIEINAVADVFSRGRDANRPLLVGSVKTNIGHLECAAGIAGLIKAVMSLERGVIPRHLHFNEPNSSLDWDNLPLQVTTDKVEWPRHRERPGLAGVNSFGISGTNAHVVVEEYRDSNGDGSGKSWPVGSGQHAAVSLPSTISSLPVEEVKHGSRRARLLPLSGKTEDALKDMAKRYSTWLDDHADELTPDGSASGPLLSDMSWTASVGRSHFDYRGGAVFHDTESLQTRLRALAEGGTDARPGTPSKVAFIYTGQGSQWTGMGQALYETEPVARAVMDRCETVFRQERGASLLDVMFGRNKANEDLGNTAWEQPALYTLECALTALWASVGIRPSVVLGHSVGEIAAAQAAGVFSLEDGMRFAAARGTLLSQMEQGTMAAVFAPAEQVSAEVEAFNEASYGVGLSVAADNGAHQVVSGMVADIEAIVEHFEAQELRVRKLNTTRAFHSALVEPVLGGLEDVIDRLEIRPPSLTFISNLTGSVVASDMTLDVSYWTRHARQAVSFASGVRTMAELDVDLVVEIGPHDVLGTMATLAWPDSGQVPAVLASLRRPPRGATAPDPESTFIDVVAEAYEVGLDISFEGLFAGETRSRISLPSYPFQRERYWVEQSRQRRQTSGHPLLGVRHESARGEISFETEVFPSDPAWLNDHRVFGRLIAPGALYGAMAASALLAEGSTSVVMEDIQLHNPLVFSENDTRDGMDENGRTVQIVLNDSQQGSSLDVQIFSKGSDSDWTTHIEGRVLPGALLPEVGGRIDLESIKARLSPSDVQDYYRAKAETGINLGPSFRTLVRAWAGPGEALAEVLLPESVGRNELDVHPLVLDGCFQVVGIARNMKGADDEPTYLPFGWERMWLTGQLPDRVVCHVCLSEGSQRTESASVEHPEILSGDLRIYDPSGVLISELTGYMVKRATEAALLSAIDEIDDLLYEIDWRDRPLESKVKPADFFPSPSAAAAGTELFSDYLTSAGVDPDDRDALLEDLEQWSRSYALFNLERLGWQRKPGDLIDPEDLRKRLNVNDEHQRLFRRMLEMLASSGVLEEIDGGFVVLLGPNDPLPEELPGNPEDFYTQMAEKYAHGQVETGLFRRSGGALANVLRGQEDPLTLLFSSGEPTAADLYLKAPVARAANQMLGKAVRTLVAQLPEGRRLRVLEIGAGTGSATASVLPELPSGMFDYVYTDISAGFFAEAEERFGDGDGAIEYRPLDIERDPIEQGFDSHGYDLLIASNVLHATRYLQETLANCSALLAPSGHLVALENLRGLGWMDLTFGQLDGWWRFADEYRPQHALVGPDIWRQALTDVGFEEVEVLGVDEADTTRKLDKGVIVAQGPARIIERPGAWLLASDDDSAADKLATELAARNQTVVIAGKDASANGRTAAEGSSVVHAQIDPENRESWRSLIEDLPGDIPFNGVVHLQGLAGHGMQATSPEISEDMKRVGASALALVQGVSESDLVPANGISFVTSGAQVLERESGGNLAGSILWGLGKVVSLEAGHLRPRMIDLDPSSTDPLSDLVDELLYPDWENHIAYRRGSRQAARLVRPGEASERLTLPEETSWVLAPNRDGVFEKPEVKLLPPRVLGPREVRIAVEATGLNFWDVFRSLGFIEEGDLGREMCGFVIDVGPEVSTVTVGDHVVGLGFGAFAPEMITREELVAPAPDDMSVSDLATIPSAFVSSALSYQYSGLEAGDRVLIHAGAGGVGLAAIQMAQAAGAEVFATASAPKQEYLRAIGVKHIFDSRQTKFGEEILEATGGEGVTVVLNSLTSEGFIEASLACLSQGGRFVELARRDILSVEEMAEVRPDVKYAILELDVLKKTDPGLVGEVLRDVMARVSTGELKPLVHSRWPLAQAGAALSFMRAARHIGKIVLTTQPLVTGQLRHDRAYLVTGGLGGIGIAVAEWLADNGACNIVLNGRRDPDPEAVEAIDALRERGVRIEVELADVTDTAAIDAMLERIDEKLPPLGGVVHSVGVLSDAALTNQTWQSFEQVLSPKIVGAWHLHRATLDRDLDLFILFSSRVGVMGNPGQANHAAANAFLDQLAGHRRALGLPGQSIAWGAWSEIGEAAEQRDRIEQRRAALGGRWFTPQQGLRALEKIVREDSTNSVVMSMDWSVFEEAVEQRPPLLEDLLSSVADDTADTSTPTEDLLSRLRSSSAAEYEDVLVSLLQDSVQAVLRLSTAPSPTVGFFDLGMDSLMAVELRNRLNRSFDGEYVVSNTAVFDYPDVTSLARHFAEEIGQLTGAESEQVEAVPDPVVPEQKPVADSKQDGIAIVGMACRFPQARDLSAFWQLLVSGTDAVTDGRPGAESLTGVNGGSNGEMSSYMRGAYLNDIELFDSDFFRIAPIEARMMDPKQRMMLETSWEALEDAGIDPEGLRGSLTGVYAGVSGSEYRDLVEASNKSDSYLGTTASVTVGRIAFALGLEGPAMPIDMACASSLAAVHQAAIALQRGEVDLALAGGVHVVLSEAINRFMAEAGMLSSTGRCSPFDASANGYVRGEGCGMIVLKRLSEALADGDRIWAVIRGSAVNQNGASAGLTVPNGPAQERVMETALAQAGIAGAEVDYYEAHAVGSQMGDAIEIRAVGAVYGQGRDSDRPLLVGTVKSNMGHLETAAGIAGLIKAVLAMKQGVIPKHLHFENPNPEVDWDRLPIKITSSPTEWPECPNRPLRAAVSAFGISGSNAHMVVEGYGGRSFAGPSQVVKDALPAPEADLSERKIRLLPLSGKTGGALRDLAVKYLTRLDNSATDESELADMALMAGVGRSHFPHRAGVVFSDLNSLKGNLKTVVETNGTTDVTNPQPATRAAFLFADEGGQWVGMGGALYSGEPVARAVLDRCDALVRDARGESLLDVMFGRPGAAGDLDDPLWAQPAVYALQSALAALWDDVGLRPDAVLGDGLGEIAAAQAAGVFGLDDGLRLAMARGALMTDSSAIDNFEAVLSRISFGPSTVTFVSSVNGRAVETGSALDASYWGRRLDKAALLKDNASSLNDLGVDIVIEISPNAKLATQPEQQRSKTQSSESHSEPVVIASMTKPSGDDPAECDTDFVKAVAGAYEAGLAISFDGMFSGELRRRVSIPTYPFQRRRHWI